MAMLRAKRDRNIQAQNIRDFGRTRHCCEQLKLDRKCRLTARNTTVIPGKEPTKESFRAAKPN